MQGCYSDGMFSCSIHDERKVQGSSILPIETMLFFDITETMIVLWLKWKTHPVCSLGIRNKVSLSNG